MIKVNSSCFRNLKVGDQVVVKLLPYHHNARLKTFHDPITFPVVGFRRYFSNENEPIVGTQNGEFYDHHLFVRSYLFGDPIMSVCAYGQSLNTGYIEIEKIIKKQRPASH